MITQEHYPFGGSPFKILGITCSPFFFYLFLLAFGGLVIYGFYKLILPILESKNDDQDPIASTGKTES